MSEPLFAGLRAWAKSHPVLSKALPVAGAALLAFWWVIDRLAALYTLKTPAATAMAWIAVQLSSITWVDTLLLVAVAWLAYVTYRRRGRPSDPPSDRMPDTLTERVGKLEQKVELEDSIATAHRSIAMLDPLIEKVVNEIAIGHSNPATFFYGTNHDYVVMYEPFNFGMGMRSDEVRTMIRDDFPDDPELAKFFEATVQKAPVDPKNLVRRDSDRMDWSCDDEKASWYEGMSKIERDLTLLKRLRDKYASRLRP